MEGERENRMRSKQTTKLLLHERTMEFERLLQQYEALTKVELEQQALIERLSNNEA